MTDRLTPDRRSWLMSRVKSKNTSPEICVRKLAHSLGLRFRLHRNDLPGTPDLVFPKYRIALFVHGCFWHRHPGCKKASTPKTDVQNWEAKFRRNVERDEENFSDLRALGWSVEIIWECETKSIELLKDRLTSIFMPVNYVFDDKQTAEL